MFYMSFLLLNIVYVLRYYASVNSILKGGFCPGAGGFSPEKTLSGSGPCPVCCLQNIERVEELNILQERTISKIQSIFPFCKY